MNTQNSIDSVSKIAGVFPNLYDDGLSPSVKSSGKTLNLIPRAINAALTPLENWILNKEYSIKETKLLLEEKLQSRDSNNIVSPEPYVAVPALQLISYCTNSHALRNMYANLLANSMDSTIKDAVHPAYVELIKQMSPFDASLLSQINSIDSKCFIYKITLKNPNSNNLTLTRSDQLTISENNYDELALSIDNLKRLNIISVDYFLSANTTSLNSFIDNKALINDLQNDFPTIDASYTFRPDVLSIRTTNLGKSFAKICID